MRIGFQSAVAMFLLASVADAHEFKAGSITVEHPWARPAAKGNSAAYFELGNTGQQADRLLGVSTDIARVTELHTSSVDAQGVATMRPVQGVDLPPGGQAQFAPGGLHVMLIGLARPLVEGEEFPLTLKFKHAGSVTVEVAIEKKASHGTETGMGHDHTKPSQ